MIRDRPRWDEIAAIFYDALERSPEERDEFLVKACGTDAALLSKLRRMLEEHTTEGGFLDNPTSLIETLVSSQAGAPSRFSPGDVLCKRFRISSFIAKGGMGEVYEAFDAELGEPVALKMIRKDFAAHPRMVEQFKREVRRTREIQSPQVCRVHDLFTDEDCDGGTVVFLTMKLLRGETLAARVRRGRLSTEEALPIVEDMAKGLAAAHREQIVHGDFKSGNVLLAREGNRTSAVITDFGLARRLPGAGETESTADFLGRGGTPPYMAPEQLLGQQPTPASDIFALGVVLYEMVTGRLPFSEESGRQRTALPPPPSVGHPGLPRSWDETILRCLAPRAEDRFASPLDVYESLAGRVATLAAERTRKWIGTLALFGLVIGAFWLWSAGLLRRSSAATAENSVAVLPFASLESSPNAEYFTEAFTEDVANTLTRLPGLKVSGRESAFRLQRNHQDPAEIAKLLKVRYVVTGRMQRRNGQLNITADLSQAPGGRRVWSREYTVKEAAVDSARNRIVADVAESLHVEHAAMLQADAPSTATRLGARDSYWLGRFYWRKRTQEGVQTSLRYFQTAIETDAGFAPAYSGLADAYCVMAEGGDRFSPAESLSRAKDAAHTANVLDPNLADAYVSLGQVASLYDRDLPSAERHFKKAITLDPHLISAHQWYSYLLIKTRRFPEALAQARLALAEDELSIPANINLAMQLFYIGAYDEALQQCRKLTILQPDLFFQHLVIAQIFARKGLISESLREMEQVREDQRNDATTLRTQAEIFAVAGMRQESDTALRALADKSRSGLAPPSYVASAYAAQGNRLQALAWLEQAIAQYDGFASMANVYPTFDSVRADPRFKELMDRLGIR